MNTYRGLLIATLTAPVVATPIDSVNDLVLQEDLPWRLEQGGIILHTFKVRCHLYNFCFLFCMKWRPPSLSELTPY